MIRQVLVNYFSSFRWSNIKQETKFAQIWTFLYIVVGMPATTSLVSENTTHSINYFFWAIPFLFGFFSAELVSIRLPKIYYLSPMNREQRTKYIHIWFWVKVCMPVVLGVICTCCTVWFRTLPREAVYILTTVLSFFTLQLGICISPEYLSRRLKDRKEKYKDKLKSRTPKGLGFYSVVSVLIGTLGGIVFAVGLEESDFAPENIGIRIGLWIAIALMLLVDAKLLSYVNPVLDNYVDYEMALYVNWEDGYVSESN